MFAFKLIQLVETRAEPLSEGLMRRLKKNDSVHRALAASTFG